MKAVVYKEPYQVAVEEVPEPAIQAPDDAIIKITSTNIEAPAAYDKFDKRVDGYTKVVLHPAA
jgi:threonine dehydrogenase-like Zn-dependent dehydrogenase